MDELDTKGLKYRLFFGDKKIVSHCSAVLKSESFTFSVNYIQELACLILGPLSFIIHFLLQHENFNCNKIASLLLWHEESFESCHSFKPHAKNCLLPGLLGVLQARQWFRRRAAVASSYIRFGNDGIIEKKKGTFYLFAIFQCRKKKHHNFFFFFIESQKNAASERWSICT